MRLQVPHVAVEAVSVMDGEGGSGDLVRVVQRLALTAAVASNTWDLDSGGSHQSLLLTLDCFLTFNSSCERLSQGRDP